MEIELGGHSQCLGVAQAEPRAAVVKRVLDGQRGRCQHDRPPRADHQIADDLRRIDGRGPQRDAPAALFDKVDESAIVGSGEGAQIPQQGVARRWSRARSSEACAGLQCASDRAKRLGQLAARRVEPLANSGVSLTQSPRPRVSRRSTSKN